MLCPGSVRSRFIDTEIQIEWYGAVILCDLCVIEMGRLFGMAPVEEVGRLMSTLAEKNVQIFELQKQLAALEGVRDALAAGGWVAPDSSNVLAVPSPDGEGTADSTSPGQGDVGAQGGATPESVHDEGLAELRPDGRSDGSILTI